MSPADSVQLERYLAQFAGNPSIRDLLIETALDRSSPPGTRLIALHAMRSSGSANPSRVSGLRG